MWGSSLPGAFSVKDEINTASVHSGSDEMSLALEKYYSTSQ